MVFSSLIFLFAFLPLTLFFYFNLPKKFQNLFLLVASLFFYAYGEGFFVFAMVLTIIFNWFSGFLIEKYRKNSKVILFTAVFFNLLFLGVYKYANFFIDTFNALFNNNLSHLNIHLPIGISFFTFQAISYVVDVYRNETPAQKNPLNLALYISLFPQLIAGPIVRYSDIAKQLIKRKVTTPLFISGVERFVTGLAKKVLIANVLSKYTDFIFSLNSFQLTTVVAWIGAVSFVIQAYFDFSGYSDMAIGLGKMFGFRFKENFNYPYISKSIREFWRRWHISLSTWFRDYVYIPLGGNKKGNFRTYFNLFMIFFLCGLWHGASWTFVIFGIEQGLIMVFERLWLGKKLKRFPVFAHFYAILTIIISFAIFRAENFSQILFFLKAMFDFNFRVNQFFHSDFVFLFTLFVGAVFSLPIVPFLRKKLYKINNKNLKKQLTILKIIIFVSLFVAVILQNSTTSYNPFIYFRF